MPNHVTNIIKFYCDNEKVEEIKNFMKSDKSEFDFNKLIPMPDDLNIESGSRGDTGLIAYRKYLAESAGLDEEKAAELEEAYKGRCDYPEVWSLGKKYYENIRQYGSPNWYDWRIRNWGTKWNAYDISWPMYTVWFDTAWSPVPQIIEALSKKFPDVEMDYRWADEDIGYNVGSISGIIGGDLDEADTFVPDGGSKEAYELFFAIHGADPDDYDFRYNEQTGTYEYQEEEY